MNDGEAGSEKRRTKGNEWMLTYDLTREGENCPLYQLLYRYIRDDVTSGRLEAGFHLPSKRSFAKNLGVSVVTVENAYEQLMAEGYVRSVPKSGYFVTDRRGGAPSSAAPSNGEPKQTAWVADFTSNQTPPSLFPFTSWASVIREVLSDSRIQLMTNSPWGGVEELRESIGAYLRGFRGMDVEARQIIIGAGTEYLYGQLIKLLGYEKCYGVENPGYAKISQIYESSSVRCRYVDMDAEGIMVSELERGGVDVVHVSPSHHFPTGMVMPVSRRYELLGWASKSPDRYVIEDDYDSELRLSGQPLPTLQSIDVSNKVIYMNTFTKTLASTVRIGYMVLPLPLLEEYQRRLSFHSCTVSNFEQYTLARFMENGGFEKHVNRMRNHYLRKRDAFLEAIQKSPIGPLVTITGEEAGVHFLMEISTGVSDEELVAAARERGLRLSPLSHYDHGEEKRFSHVFVINYSSMELDRMDQAVKIITDIVLEGNRQP